MTNQIGTMIHNGPKDWVIIQQQNGKGSVLLSGIWAVPEEEEVHSAQAYARVVREDDGSIVVAWQPCEMSGGQNWSIQLAGIPTGGLYRIETNLNLNDSPLMEWAMRGDMIHHVGVGDLWIIAGQSNAAGYGRGPFHDPHELGVHLFRNNGGWDVATHPFNESTNSTHMENRERGNPGHSPFLAFGKWLRKETGMPIGFIQTALGGSPLKAWNPDEDGILYRNMMNIVKSVGGKVRGMLWYQGCSDCNKEESVTYLERFANFVSHVRHDLRVELPILTVQLNRLTADVSCEVNQSWGIVREAQRLAALQVTGVSIVPALDCPLSDHIHNSPAGNILIGERLAKAAMAFVYKKHEPFHAPEISRAVLSSSEVASNIRMEFQHVQGYLITIGAKSKVFTVIDTLGEIDIIDWQISSRTEISLTLAREPQGEAFLHGAYEANPASFLPLDTGTYMPMLAFYGHRICIELN